MRTISFHSLELYQLTFGLIYLKDKSYYSSQVSSSTSFSLGILKTAEHAGERKFSRQVEKLRRVPSRERTQLVSTRAISPVSLTLG